MRDLHEVVLLWLPGMSSVSDNYLKGLSYHVNSVGGHI